MNIAVEKGDFDIIKLLLEHPDININDKSILSIIF